MATSPDNVGFCHEMLTMPNLDLDLDVDLDLEIDEMETDSDLTNG